MASTDKADPEYSTTTSTPAAPAGVDNSKYDVILRFLLFASSLVAVVVLVTGNQTELLPLSAGFIPWSAKFRYSPAFVYFVAAFSVSGLYSIITLLASLYAIKRPTLKIKLLLYFIFWDALILGITASAIGTAGGIAYLGLKGNSHVIGWNKICNRYDKFCRHTGASLGVGLFGSVVTLLLIWVSASSIHSRIPK